MMDAEPLDGAEDARFFTGSSSHVPRVPPQYFLERKGQRFDVAPTLTLGRTQLGSEFVHVSREQAIVRAADGRPSALVVEHRGLQQNPTIISRTGTGTFLGLTDQGTLGQLHVGDRLILDHRRRKDSKTRPSRFAPSLTLPRYRRRTSRLLRCPRTSRLLRRSRRLLLNLRPQRPRRPRRLMRTLVGWSGRP